MIYYCTASLEKSIYLWDGVGGFTSQVDNFVEANTDVDACEGFRTHLEKRGIRVRKVTANLAKKQDKATYDCPQNILSVTREPRPSLP